MSNAKRFTCYLSFEVGTVTGTARKIFHNNEMIALTFADMGKAQDLIPCYGNRARLLTLSSWEAQSNYSMDTITKKLEFLGLKPIYVEVAEDGTKSLYNKSVAA